MPIVAIVIRIVARGLERLGHLVLRLSDVFYNLLPVFCPPHTLSRMVRGYYERVYTTDQTSDSVNPRLYSLEDWERELLDRYGIRSGRMLVLGAGRGREGIAISRRGLHVVAVESNPAAVRLGRRVAAQCGTPVQFFQADFLDLPFVAGSFDYAFLADLMYSATPGRAQRQAWLKALLSLLTPGGLLVLSFAVEYPTSGSRGFRHQISSAVSRLPGTSETYEDGDTCYAGHYLHVFPDEAAVHAELSGSGGLVKEVVWPTGYGVIAAPARVGINADKGAG
jgi:SAM-dependent methyltransferase